MNAEKLSRRTFVRNTSLMAVGAIAGGLVGKDTVLGGDVQPVDTSSILNYNPKMGYRRLGKTDLLISEISLGGHWATREGGRFWVEFRDGRVPDDVVKNRHEVISRCIDCGINLLDPVTPAELAAYATALKGRRDKMYLAASSHTFNPYRKENCRTDLQMSNIEDCLKCLGTDCLDIWRPMFRQDGKHSDGEVEACVAAFEKAHRQGKARWMGMSSHNRSFIQHVIEKFPQVSVVIFPYTAKSKTKTADLASIDATKVVEIGTGDGVYSGDVSRSVFDAVQNHDIGVITIKPFSGGSLFRTRLTFEKTESTEQDNERARLTLAYVLSNPMISATIPGMTSIDQVTNNARASAERLSLLDHNGIRKLRQAAEEMWANLPDEYLWLRHWEWV